MRGLGREPKWRAVPTGLALTGARVLEALAHLDPRRREPLVTAYSLGLFAFSHTLDIGKARTRLGWSPQVSFDDALETTLRSLRLAVA